MSENISKAKSWFLTHYSDEDVTNRFNLEILEWIDDDWSDDYESEYDYYIDHNNREAEDVIINEMWKHLCSDLGEIINEIEADELLTLLYTVL